MSRTNSIVAGIRKAFGKRRGGAGAVAAALAVFAVVAILGVSVAGQSKSFTPPTDDRIPDPNAGIEPVPWEKPVVKETAPSYNGATPQRLPL